MQEWKGQIWITQRTTDRFKTPQFPDVTAISAGVGGGWQPSEDLLMDRVIDLDQAAAEIVSRLPAWTASGLRHIRITWRDATATWPQSLETDRALVNDPDSVGVRIESANESNIVSIVLFRGGWADLDALVDGEFITECPHITRPEEFGALLDSAITRFVDMGRPPVT